MNSRDFDYIEVRLAAPAVAVSDACERLRAVGLADLAERLMVAHEAFSVACREVRYELADRYFGRSL